MEEVLQVPSLHNSHLDIEQYFFFLFYVVELIYLLQMIQFSKMFRSTRISLNLFFIKSCTRLVEYSTDIGIRRLFLSSSFSLLRMRPCKRLETTLFIIQRIQIWVRINHPIRVSCVMKYLYIFSSSPKPVRLICQNLSFLTFLITLYIDFLLAMSSIIRSTISRLWKPKYILPLLHERFSCFSHACFIVSDV